MKIYLCKKCNKTVPLNELTEHQRQCGPGSEIALKRGFGSKAGGFFKGLFMLLAAVLLVGAGIWLGISSFESIASMRQLERVPATVVSAALPGEVNLNGKALVLKRTLKGPKSGAACLYYRYLVEKKERDSEGKTRWRTVSDKSRHVDFTLADGTGKITLRPDSGVDFSVARSFRREIGGYRYSEWRIDPKDKVFVFGYVVAARNAYEVRFDRPGHYDPIISEYGEERERLGMASASIGMCWGGLVALAFATGLAVALFRMHRLLVYFTILGLIMLVDLSILGLRMMQSDLRSAVARVNEHEQTAKQVVTATLERAGGRWDGDWSTLGEIDEQTTRGLSLAEAARVRRIRLDLALAIERVRSQRSAFPECLLAPLWRIPRVSSLPLPPAAQSKLAERAARFRKAEVPPAIGWAVAGVAVLIAIVTFAIGFRKVRFKRCIENLPTSPTAGAAYGLSEFKGVVELPDQTEPLLGPVSGVPCVDYHYVVKERRGSGKNSRWVTVVNERNRRPFLCRDAEGTILVDPDGADVMTMHRASRHEGRYRHTETRLEVEDPLYAIGECVIEPTCGDSLYLKDPEGSYPFILSNYPEVTVMRKIAAVGIFLLNLSFAAILLMTLTLFGLSGSFAATDYLAAALASPIFMTIITLALHYNDLVFLRERANRNWSNIDVSLQKRADLLPNLEKMAKAYMAHESELQQAITEMRTAYGAGKPEGSEAIGRFMDSEHAVLSRILAVYENYPELKADRSSGLLMRTMITLENEISLMRTGYNNAVETYNTRIQTLPDLFFARMFRFKDKDFIHAESEVIRVPPSLQNMWETERLATARQEAPTEAAPAAPGATPPTAPPPAPAPQSAALAAAAAATPDAAGRVEEDMTAEATDARAVIYALLLNTDQQTRKKQLETVAHEDSEAVSKKAAGLVEAVSQQIKDDVARLKEAEDWFEKLKSLSPGGYRAFKALVRKLMEQDEVISLFEYALQKSIARQLDPIFGMAVARPERYRDLGPIVQQASLALSRLAHAELKPSETEQAAFELGVNSLNHTPKSELVMVPLEQCTLAAFDAALEEIAHAVHTVKANFLYACRTAVEMNQDYSYDQALLLIAMADTFGLDRPPWVFSG